MKSLQYSEILKQNQELAKTLNSNEYKVGVLSNITVNPVKEILEFSLRREGLNANVVMGNFDSIVQDSESFKGFQAIVIFWETCNLASDFYAGADLMSSYDFECLQKKLELEIGLVLKNLKDVPLVLLNRFSSALFNKSPLNKDLVDMLCAHLNDFIETKVTSNQIVVNHDLIISQIGFLKAFDLRQFKSSGLIFSIEFFKNYVDAIKPAFCASTGRVKKILVLDCDNTLWGGVVGEDGIDGIELGNVSARGKIFSDVQKIIVALQKQGVLLALCSKNNSKEIDNVISSHPDMLITEDMLVCKKVNWVDKATNIRQISLDLNIGLDSFVFVDDSYFEIGLIKRELPQVKCIQVPEVLSDYPGIIKALKAEFFSFTRTVEDEKKTAMYLEEKKRKDASLEFTNIDDYLASLGLQVSLFWNDNILIPRASQMTQKTNQFNLTTKRYTESEISRMVMEGKFSIAMLSVADNFGDYGVTGMAIIDISDPQKVEASVDTFLMSCRVIGRNIELIFFDELVAHLSKLGFMRLCATYIPTSKNSQVSQFYDSLGFDLRSDNHGLKTYTIDLSAYKSKSPVYIRKI